MTKTNPVGAQQDGSFQQNFGTFKTRKFYYLFSASTCDLALNQAFSFDGVSNAEDLVDTAWWTPSYIIWIS